MGCSVFCNLQSSKARKLYTTDKIKLCEETYMYMASKIEHLAWHLQLTRFAKYYSSTVYTITIRKIKSKSASIVEVLLTLSVTFIVLCMNKQIRISLSLSNLSLDYSYETNKSKCSFHSCRLGCYFYIDDAFSHGFKNQKKNPPINCTKRTWSWFGFVNICVRTKAGFLWN